jgi:preprotein translocase subunit SecF
MKNPFKAFLDPKTQIVKHGKWYVIAPAAIILVGLLVVIIFGFNLGLDFTGGRIITIGEFGNEKTKIESVSREVLRRELGAGLAGKSFLQFEEGDGGGGLVLSVRYQEPKGTEDEIAAINTAIQDGIVAEMSNSYSISVSVKVSDEIPPSTSADRLLNVFIAIFASLIGILIYMLFRFKFTSGVAAIVALFHDALIMLAAVAVFRIQINFVFVAAVITVVAYSLNNTLVLFDRVRDKERDVSNTQTVEQKVDSSIKETFWRTTVTTVTTLVPVIILCIFGVTSIREFALPIVFGLLAGTYSTICITSSLYVRFENARAAQKKLKKANSV